ncbi:MAG: hypothetical protein N2487_02965 [Verrucomicrobiae bacterium]|nr:hypothetical protein [Verrucomicrobiae bacterium]
MELRNRELNIQKELIVEIAGDKGALPEKKIVKEAILAVIHYLKADLKKDVVAADEFSEMLETVLEGFGYHVKALVKNREKKDKKQSKTVYLNLQDIIDESGSCYELFFFDQLAKTMRETLKQNPNVLYINGLRESVKKIIGVNKWDRRCSNLSEEIINFARGQFAVYSNKKASALLIK